MTGRADGIDQAGWWINLDAWIRARITAAAAVQQTEHGNAQEQMQLLEKLPRQRKRRPAISCDAIPI